MKTLLLHLTAALLLTACAPSKPNIIIVITDDQGYGDLTVHGSPDVRTPNLDRLHEQSIRFTDFQVSPTCSPTRSALETGRSPFRNGISHTINERERMTLDAVTLPQMLSEAGYVSAIFGKWHLGDEDEYQPDARGYDRIFIHGAGGIGQKYPGSCADVPGNSYFNPIIKDQSVFVQTTGFCTDVFFDEALKWIKQQHDKRRPFYARISTNAPHAPFVAPEKYTRYFAEKGYSGGAQGYYGMVENIDFNMGLLLDSLEKWGIEENTLLIFMTDNGKALHTDRIGPDGKPQNSYNAGMKAYKGTVHEGGTRVPFFVRWPQKLQGGRDIETMACHFDIYPTLAQIAGVKLPRPEQIEGRSLWPLLEGGNPQWDDRYRIFHAGRWPVGADPEDYKYQDFAVRNEQFRLVGMNELYEVRNDPGETTNVFDQHPEVVSEMMKAYEEWWEETKLLLVNEGVPLSPTKPYFERYYQQLKNGGIPARLLP